MKNLIPQPQTVNSTYHDAITWLESKGVNGELRKGTAQNWVSAMRALGECLRDDEPSTAQFLLDNVEELARRWANLHPDRRGDTARFYESRARTALRKYAAWLEDPTSVRFESRTREKSQNKKPSKRQDKPTSQAELPMHEPVNRSPEHGGALRDFPLDEGRSFVFSPPKELTKDEVMRISAHLLTFAPDFEFNFGITKR